MLLVGDSGSWPVLVWVCLLLLSEAKIKLGGLQARSGQGSAGPENRFFTQLFAACVLQQLRIAHCFAGLEGKANVRGTPG